MELISYKLYDKKTHSVGDQRGKETIRILSTGGCQDTSNKSK